MTTTKILCNCTVDDLGMNQFEVETWGQAPFDYRRVYTLAARNDTAAAMEGLRLFQEEAEILGPRDAQEQ